MELFVTDLDGTLLNSHKEVSIKSIEILNKLIDDGVNFTVATARTPATVVDLLQDVDAYNIAHLAKISDDSTAINSLKDYYVSGRFEDRLNKFITGRFGSTESIYS